MPTHKFADQFLSFLNKLNNLLRLLLKLAIICIIISCFLTLFFQKYLTLEYEYLGSFIWISITGGLWIGILSTIAIILTAIIQHLNKGNIWPNIKREVVLLLGLVLSILVFTGCGMFWVYGDKL